MRKLSLVFSFLVAAVVATVAYNHASDLVGDRRTYVQESWLNSAEPMGYQGYDETGSVQ